MLVQAFGELLGTERFSAISVQSIASKANVNRATFYDHFPDKYVLLEEVVRDQFRSIVSKRMENQFQAQGQLASIIMATLEALADIRDRCKPDKVMEPLAYSAVQHEIHDFMLKWLEQQPTRDAPKVSVKSMASICGWSIFGSGLEWSRSKRRMDAETMASEILAFVVEGLSDVLGPFDR